MPSLKMKTKSTISYLREKNCLRVCQDSSMKSKSSFPHIRICQQAPEFETSTQSKLDGPFCNKLCVQNNADDDASCLELLGEENLQFRKQLSPSTDYATAMRMESAPATCASNLETIFSPVLESTDNHSERIAHGDGGTLDMLPLGADDSDDNSRSSSGYQTCNVSDFYVSDMIVSGLPIEGDSVHDDFTETTSLADYKCDEPSMFFNENFIILPFLEDTMESSKGHDSRLSEETVTHSDDSSLYLAIHQLRSCNQEPDVNTYLDWDQAEFFDPHMFIRNLPDLSDVAPNSRSARKTKSITLVLDLDETLVHSTLEHCDDADFTFPVVVNMKEHIVYVKQRPYLHAFLERVAEMFEIVVFTASQSIYAKQLLDILDPEGKLIARRAYRESCIFTDGSYTKDLTVLGVDLAKIVIIDNSPQVFRLQVNNGIPIRSWFDDPSDSALVSLLPFLETLVDAEDVRPIIAKRFGNKE